ncbi:ATP-binding protein [Sphaerisporangium aureirubrum]|uniref:ATP-binding protein n=1 Tax=Sphaerisporangium aureirubrum TaxID=1544736 RepID=A0ABW1NKB7_9ACTN
MSAVPGTLTVLGEPPVPDAPHLPEIPDAPHLPATPDPPHRPDTQDVPHRPDTRDAPRLPATPDVPRRPDTQDVPRRPDTQDAPRPSGMPDAPDGPDDSDVPGSVLGNVVGLRESRAVDTTARLPAGPGAGSVREVTGAADDPDAGEQAGGRISACWVLGESVSSIPLARRLVRACLADWGLAEDGEVAELLVTELVANALRHAWGTPVLTLSADGSVLRCEVQDSSPESPHLLQTRVYDETGRGLHLVDLLARHWGVRQGPGGKTVWFDLVAHSGE